MQISLKYNMICKKEENLNNKRKNKLPQLEPQHVWTWNVPKNAHIEDIDKSMVVTEGLIDHSTERGGHPCKELMVDIRDRQNDGTLQARLHPPRFFTPSQWKSLTS